MRVVFMHNPRAGGEEHCADDLAAQIVSAGHRIVGDVSRRKDLGAALKKPCDLVVLAGGDGTVGAAAEVLAGTGVPFTIIPVGTANNVATDLGFKEEVERLIDGWKDGAVRGLDRGIVRYEGKERSFLEGFGMGLFPEVMHLGVKRPMPDDPDAVLDRDLRLFREAASRHRPARYTIWADGEDLSGEYLMVEVMNFGLLGANVQLCHADPGDGRLDLVLVGDHERGALLDHVTRLSAGKVSRLRFPVKRADRVVISVEARRFHLDGDLHAIKRERRAHFDVRIEPHALQVLLPRAA